MPYTPQQESQFRREFVTRRRRQLLITGLFFLPVVMVAVLERNQPGAVDAWMGVPIRAWLVASFALILVAIAASVRNWRCPACSGSLSRTLNQTTCPKCGVVLQ